MCLCVCVSQYSGEGQRATCESQVSISTTWVGSRVEPQSSGLLAPFLDNPVTGPIDLTCSECLVILCLNDFLFNFALFL